MSPFVNLVGERFGKLIVLERAANVNGYASSWLCECACGKKIIKSRQNLFSKKYPATSCGCSLSRKMRPKDLTGIRIDKLTFLKKVGKDKHGYGLWLCKCDCGKEIIKSRSYIFKSPLCSCGCAYKHVVKKENDLTGKRFGGLTVLRHDNKEDYRHQHFWLCLCDCGKEKVISSSRLNGGKIDCGCSATKKALQGLELGQAGFNKIASSYKRSAKKRGLRFTLSDGELKNLMLNDCFYCGSKPLNKRRNQSNHSTFTYNGIDRVDNFKGYEQGNVVTCCKWCNRMKYNYTKDNFIKHCILIDAFQKSKKVKLL